ncbi:MAG: hypothetical protein AAFN13_14845 [Bacteroidota bacterium]
MQQTLLAFCALGLTMLLSVNQKQAQKQVDVALDRTVIQQAAATRAADLLDVLETFDFDAATASTTITDPSALTAPPFSTGGRFANADDLDDVHAMQTLQDSVATPQGWLPLSVDAQVTYVDKVGSDFVATTTRTFTKRVTLTVTGPNGTTVEMSRIYGYTRS